VLRKRLITVLTFNEGVLFRTKLFTPDYRYTANFVDAWSIDEIVVLDITRDRRGKEERFAEVVSGFASRCFVPLAAGGGIRSVADVRRYLGYGADKVVVNTGALERPELITEVATLFGSQCVVASIDAKRTDDGHYDVHAACGTHATGRDAVAWAQEAEERGAGEVLITAMDRDGHLQGYDLDLCRRVADAVSVPVLILGGAGNWNHFLAGFVEGDASAVCTQNIYHFTEKSISSAKKFLIEAGVPVRL
jgi:cyclase